MTQFPDAERYNWPSTLNPDFDEAKDRELVLLYGGRGSPGYLHRVLGQHGAPMHAVFHLDDYLGCVDPALDFHDLVLREGEDFAAPADIPRGEYYLGCDLGYARDPSEFVVYRNDAPHFVNVLRLHLEGVNYARQQRIIEELERAYDFRAIGIDAGNSGRAVAHQLLAQWDRWCASAQEALAKVHAFEFGGALPLEPLPSGEVARRRVKEFMTELIQRRMAEGTIRFPACPDRESQYAGHTYSVGPTGAIVYDKGNDHLIDADRCAVLAHHLDTLDRRDVVSAPPILLGY
jgi:hypothetical protein